MTNTTDEDTTETKAATGIPALIGRVIERVNTFKPVRVFTSYGNTGGPLMASGMAYQALFAVFAAIWVGFSIAGLVLAGNPRLMQAAIDVVAQSAPGLIGEGGAIDPETLLSTSILGWTGAIALVGLLVTALGFLDSARGAIRRIFNVGPDTTFFLLLKLKDLGLALGFGVAILVSAALSVASTAALSWVFSLAGIDDESLGALVLARIVGLVLVFALDTFVLASFYRILSGLRIPVRRLLGGALIGAAALGVLKALGSALLGGASNNPLLASFAVIIGLLIWFNFICQVVLIGAAWIHIGLTDNGVDVRGLSADELEKEQRVTEAQARLTVATAERRRIEEEVRQARGFRRSRLKRKLERAARNEAELKRSDPSA